MCVCVHYSLSRLHWRHPHFVLWPGDTSVTVSVTTLTDQSAEDSEEFTAVLSNPSMGGVIGTADTATVTINDGTAVIVTLNPTSFSVGEDDGSAVFTVNKLTTTSRTISVLFSTTDGTAIAGEETVSSNAWELGQSLLISACSGLHTNWHWYIQYEIHM